jgi:hypothetical protein
MMVRSRYFCAGTVRDRLRSAGFPRVINQNRDFYRDAEAVPPLIPAYDVLVSNPVRNETTHPQLRTQISWRRRLLSLLPGWLCASAVWGDGTFATPILYDNARLRGCICDLMFVSALLGRPQSPHSTDNRHAVPAVSALLGRPHGPRTALGCGLGAAVAAAAAELRLPQTFLPTCIAGRPPAAGGGGEGESFPRFPGAHWVAVPQALRARRSNRRTVLGRLGREAAGRDHRAGRCRCCWRPHGAMPSIGGVAGVRRRAATRRTCACGTARAVACSRTPSCWVGGR